jgi:hypothetical protein
MKSHRALAMMNFTGLCQVACYFLSLAILLAAQTACAADDQYCIVVSKATANDSQWKTVVAALRDKHAAEVLVFEKSPEETREGLRRTMPRYICFVARPTEAGRELVAKAHQLARQLDNDPYTDAFWGIITGYDVDSALRIVRQKEPLVIHRAAAGTEIELPVCDEGLWYCELNQGKMVRKLPGGKPRQEQAPADTTRSLVDVLNEYHPQLFVTSGHATERDWQIGFRYRNGQFRCTSGQLFGLDTKGHRFPVHSENPKVFLPVGNCLMGHIDGPEAMALAYIKSAGVQQMIGYTVPTWYGYAGWGMLDYFVEQPGRFTLAEAFIANQQALIHRLATCFPGLEKANPDARRTGGKLPAPAGHAGLSWNDAEGLLYDRDTLALFGDPAWEARMASGPLAWEQKLTVAKERYELSVRPLLGQRSFKPQNKNGSQRGGRPIIHFLPEKIDPRTVHIDEGVELQPVISGRFLLVPLPDKCDPARTYRVVFHAKRHGT